jgi:hypothetical protein
MRQTRIFLLVIGIGLIGIIGCGGGDGSANVVTGKVTLGDKPVEGTIVFSGKGKEVVSSSINPDGTYKIEGVATGLNHITIKPLPKGMTQQGATPPRKYATADGGLTFEVKPGRNIKDCTLEP